MGAKFLKDKDAIYAIFGFVFALTMVILGKTTGNHEVKLFSQIAYYITVFMMINWCAIFAKSNIVFSVVMFTIIINLFASLL